MAKKVLLAFFFLILKLYANGFNVDSNFPIIYKDPFADISNRSSYFGYSVLLNDSRILIGAPRANYSSLKLVEPGVTYQCEIKGSCRKIHLKEAEKASNNANEAKTYTSAWFGVSMDQKPSGQAVVCGHRWRSSLGTAKLPGACYSFEDDKTVKFIRPIPGEDGKDNIYTHSGRNYYKTSISQSGMSVHILPSSRGKGGIFFGSPGFLDWRGNVVYHENIEHHDSAQDRAKAIDTYGILNQIHSYSYFGYHVSSGCFQARDKCLLVGGAPRGQNNDRHMIGSVSLFALPEKDVTYWTYFHSTSPRGYKAPHESKLRLSLAWTEIGEQEGEYFGSSFAVTDFTGDGLDDLIVGAPFYSFQGEGDEGRIYVFRGHQRDILKKTSTANGKKGGGRFGTAVVSVGDLDRDGFQDIAVGAPFEGNGAIYIFYGNSNASVVSSRRIAAEELSTEIKGFGISISGMADVDNNKYKDIAVGAYLSGHAVILRSRSVVTLKTRLDPHVKALSTEEILKINVCLSYEGKDVPKTLNVIRKISADETYKRARPHYQEKEMTLRENKENCEDYSFSLSNDKVNLEPLKIKLSQELSTTTVAKGLNNNKTDTDGFDLLGPVLEKSLSSEESIPFKIHCGDRNCTVHLNLTCFLSWSGQPLNDTFVIGKYDNVQLQINATNVGDTIYSSTMKVKLPEGIRLEKTSRSCEDDGQNNIKCELYNIRDFKDIALDLDMTNLEFDSNEEGIQYMQIYVMANSTADGIHRTENICNVPLNVTVNASVGVYGKPEKEIYSLTSLDKKLEIIHIYEINKEGYSPIQKFEIELYVPAKIISFKDLKQILAFQVDGGFNMQCEGDKQYTFEQSESSEMDDQVSERSRMKRSVNRNDSNAYIPPVNQTLYLNCSFNRNELCEKIICQGTELQSRKLQLKLQLNITELRPLMGKKNIIFLTTEAHVKIVNPRVTKSVFYITASSPILGVIQEIKLPLWIYVASGVGGILLLMLLAMGLAKAGFFQRTKKAQLEALMQAETKTEENERMTEGNEATSEDH